MAGTVERYRNILAVNFRRDVVHHCDGGAAFDKISAGIGNPQGNSVCPYRGTVKRGRCHCLDKDAVIRGTGRKGIDIRFCHGVGSQ